MAYRLDVRGCVGEKSASRDFLRGRKGVSGVQTLAKPYRIKAAHRRRRKVAWGQSVQRYYDPGIGRFLSVDPVSADTGAGFNRYSYANNNPYAFTDPDGRRSCPTPRDCGGAGASYVGDGMAGTTAGTTMPNFISGSGGATASGGMGGGGQASVPNSIKVESQGYKSAGDAAKAVGAQYGKEGVENKREVQLGLTKLGADNWGYLTPGWGPEGATRVDPSALLSAYIRGGFSVHAWMHGHFDRQLNFSATDFSLVWGSSRSTYLINSAGQARVLTNAHLQQAFRQLPFSSKRRGIQGLQSWHSAEGLPGDEL